MALGSRSQGTNSDVEIKKTLMTDIDKHLRETMRSR